MEDVYISAYYLYDKSSFWEGFSIDECINFIRNQEVKCLYKWHITIRNRISGKCVYSGNLGKYIFG